MCSYVPLQDILDLEGSGPRSLGYTFTISSTDALGPGQEMEKKHLLFNVPWWKSVSSTLSARLVMGSGSCSRLPRIRFISYRSLSLVRVHLSSVSCRLRPICISDSLLPFSPIGYCIVYRDVSSASKSCTEL